MTFVPFAPINIPPDGVPCDHPGCLSHVTHPCEGCGRIGGVRARPEPDILSVEEQAEVIAILRNQESILGAPLVERLAATLDQAMRVRSALAEAAREINCAGPVAHRIRVLRAEHEEQVKALVNARDRLEAKLVIMEADWDCGASASITLARAWAENWWPIINERMTPEHRSFRWALDFEAELRAKEARTKGEMP
jgi:hypothetical protein